MNGGRCATDGGTTQAEDMGYSTSQVRYSPILFYFVLTNFLLLTTQRPPTSLHDSLVGFFPLPMTTPTLTTTNESSRLAGGFSHLSNNTGPYHHQRVSMTRWWIPFPFQQQYCYDFLSLFLFSHHCSITPFHFELSFISHA